MRLSRGCGGTLVSSKHVITAAHCVEILCTGGKAMPAHQLSIKIGYHHLEGHDQTYLPKKTVQVKNIILHDDYKGACDVFEPNDIAILELEEELDLNTYTPACLARKTDNNRFAGLTATVAGWGALDKWRRTKVPHEVDIPVVSSSECARKFWMFGDSDKSKHGSQLCAASRYYGNGKGAFRVSACSQMLKYSLNMIIPQGDSGGPLTYKLGDQHVLIGDVSGGKSEPGYMNVYGDIAYFRDWIDKNLRGAKYCSNGGPNSSSK